MSAARITSPIACLTILLILAGSGCTQLAGEGEGRLQLYAMHHGTPVDGEFPDLATHPDWRQFDSEDGHVVKLADGFRTFVGVEVISCDGMRSVPADFQFDGPRAESFCDVDDFKSSTLGWAELPAGEYCSLEIHYGPYEFPTDPDDQSPVPDVPSMDGMTAMVRVTVDEENRFEWSDDFEMTVTRSIAEIEGGSALHIEQGDTSSNLLSITIAYDRLLDGVDLDDAEPSSEDVGNAVKDGLRDYTGVMWGNSLDDPDAISYEE